jgi:hypothetical protein
MEHHYMRCGILRAVNVKTVSSIVKMEAPGTFEMPGTNLSNHKALDPTGNNTRNNHFRLNLAPYVVFGVLALTVKVRVRCPTSPYEIFDGQKWYLDRFLSQNFEFPRPYNSTKAPYSYFIHYHRRYTTFKMDSGVK